MRALSVAPMMDRTDRHFRVFLRGITKQTLLYTEMIHIEAILRGDMERLLGFSPIEKPLILQLGGSDPGKLAECARVAEGLGYDGINLNVGCPSDRVQHGGFGACLMAEPERVARCVESLQAAVSIPVSVKHRLGIDDQDTYDDVVRFVSTIVDAGCKWIIVHARKAWLEGLSPHENRTIPPLRHEEVHLLKQDFPSTIVETNGGIRSLSEVADHLSHVDGVMIGRWAYEEPMGLAPVDARFFDSEESPPQREEVLDAYMGYVESELARGTSLGHLVQHIHGLYAGQPGARYWRRTLSEGARRPDSTADVIREAIPR